ncbi:MAG: hypothetical protein HY002_14125 [Candidatus Rokubacteria bacterium]|nr:hypothetical protein [Candidatus Rokubacteria bacterium]
MILLTAGVVWRIIRYSLGFPLWGDEAAVMLNVVQRHTYAELLRPLDHAQVAPLGFLAALFTAVQQLGTSEYALRLFPLITGLAALFFFARLAWLALPPLGAVSSVGVLTATHYVTRYSLDIKPYGTDLMVAAALLMLAVQWSRAPEQRRWLVLLILVTPLALVLSYPGVFVAGAIGIGLLPVLLRRQSRMGDWALFAAYNAAAVMSFAGLFYLSAAGQFEQTQGKMLLYWVRGFPPANPIGFIGWLIDVHTAEMMSYPLGGKNGASTMTLILSLVGIRLLLKRGQTTLLLLLGSIFALTFVAAVLRGYPYGGSARVAQHLAPAICLFVGAAIEGIVSAFNTAERRRTAGVIASLTLLVLAVGGTARDVLHPYHTKAHKDLYELMSAWKHDRLADSGVWLMGAFDSLSMTAQWYVLQAVDGDRTRLNSGPVDPSMLTRHREWWVLNWDPSQDGIPSLPPRAQLSGAGYVLARTSRLVLPQSHPGIPDEIVELQRWQRTP